MYNRLDVDLNAVHTVDHADVKYTWLILDVLQQQVLESY